MGVPYKPTSHEGLFHDRIDSFGFDWEKVGNPDVAPRYPYKIYVPRTVDELVRAVKESKQLGETLVVRSKGHSSNDLVFNEHGAVLYTAGLNKIVSLDESKLEATVEAGIVSADLDEILSKKGLGLPVIGDHDDITVGGFASVGGIGPASFRHGMFVDTVVAADIVTWDGELVHYSREKDLPKLNAVLCGLGRAGIFARLTVKVIRVEKHTTLLENTRHNYVSYASFLEESTKIMSNPGKAYMIRGMWVDAAEQGKPGVTFGEMMVYHLTETNAWKRFVDQSKYGYLYGLGKYQGTLPGPADMASKLMGLAGILVAPKYASIKHVEFFTDKILDSSVGDPVRWFMYLVPMDRYASLAAETYELARSYRDKHKCFTAITQPVKALRSAYLSPDNPDKLFCELNFSLAVKPALFTRELADKFVKTLDDLAVKYNAYRYMHTRTGKDPELLNKIDPAARWNPYV
ncbi:MAG TPA: FAD-dependent oxidoreductase [Polyangium sp.]|nr:FAD-dependent oxidoreductase [Polyangium sp.]